MALVSLIAIYLLLTIKPYFFVQITAHKITVDLSYRMDKNIMKWISARPYELAISHKTIVNANGTVHIQSDEVHMATHTATHLDAPIHFGGRGKWTVADIPLKHLVERPLVVLDVEEQSKRERDYLATINDFIEWEEKYGEMPEGAVVILRTGWSKFWPNRLDYWGTDTNDEKLVHFPGLRPDAANWLVNKRNVVGVGIDGPSIDCGQCRNKQAHVILNENNVYILENIERSIFDVPEVDATITILPMKLIDASGCPVRPIVQYSHSHADTNRSTSNTANLLSLILLLIVSTFYIH